MSDITNINDAVSNEFNEIIFIGDKSIYSLTSMNNVNDYDRFSINNLSEKYPDLDFTDSIQQLETIIKFNDRIFFGGTLKNNVEFGTGLINNRFTVDARLSKIESDGYIDRATSNLKSFYLSEDIMEMMNL